jgi:hypothetical protein
MDSKQLATTAHKILKEMGHEMPLGHVYELFSKLSGHKSWNVAKTKDGFDVVFKLMAYGAIGAGNYEVKVVIEEGNLELKKYYKVKANSDEEANQIISRYIAYRRGEEEMLSDPSVNILASLESEDEFLYKNWEIIWNESSPEVQEQSTCELRPIPELVLDGFLGKISKEELNKKLKSSLR